MKGRRQMRQSCAAHARVTVIAALALPATPPSPGKRWATSVTALIVHSIKNYPKLIRGDWP